MSCAPLVRDRGRRLWERRAPPSPQRWLLVGLLTLGLGLPLGLLSITTLIHSPGNARGLLLSWGVGLIALLGSIDLLALRSTRLWRRSPTFPVRQGPAHPCPDAPLATAAPRPRPARERWARAGRQRLDRRGRLLALGLGLTALVVTALGLLAGPGLATSLGLLLLGGLILRDQARTDDPPHGQRPLPAALTWLRPARVRGALRCAYCHAGVSAAPLLCRGCGAAYHAPCADELNGCASLGCSRAPGEDERRSRDRVGRC